MPEYGVLTSFEQTSRALSHSERESKQGRSDVEKLVCHLLLPMKAFRLLRWSGSILSPRTRPCLFHLLEPSQSNPRFLSATIRPLQEAIQYQNQDQEPEEDPWGSSQGHRDDDLIIPEDMPQSLQQEARLRALPSPPLSAVRSSAKLAALHARLSFSPRLPIETLARCLVDATADPNPDFNNTSLAILGRDLYGYYTSEAILCRYPRLPTAVVFAAMSAYIGPKTLTQITKEWGVELVAEPGGEVDPGYLQCRRDDSMLRKKHSPDSDTDPPPRLKIANRASSAPTAQTPIRKLGGEA